MKRKTPLPVLVWINLALLAMLTNIGFCCFILWLYPSWWTRLAVTLSIVGSLMAIVSYFRIQRIRRDLDRSLAELEKDLKP